MVQVVFTGEWSLPVREGEVTNTLVDAGCDVIVCHVDSPKVVLETAERRGVKSCGHNVSQGAIAPKGFITGAENKYEPCIRATRKASSRAFRHPMYWSALRQGHGAQHRVWGGCERRRTQRGTVAIADMRAGKPMFAGPIKDNKGRIVIDKPYSNYDPFSTAWTI